MIRTKHLVVSGLVLCLLVGAGGVFRMTTAHHAAILETLPQVASVTFAVPQEEYPAVTEVYDERTRDRFIEQIRDAYVPPPPKAPEAEPVQETPSPSTWSITPSAPPTPLPAQGIPSTEPNEYAVSIVSTTTLVATTTVTTLSGTTTLAVPQMVPEPALSTTTSEG